jgi:hypothetical protein
VAADGRSFSVMGKKKVEDRGSKIAGKSAAAGKMIKDGGLKMVGKAEKPSSILHPPSSSGDLPAQPDGGKFDFDDLFGQMSPEEIAVANRQRLQKNLMIHIGKIPSFTPLRQFEVAELIANNLIPKIQGFDETNLDSATSINVTGGVRGVAGYINNNFSGVKVSHMSIHNWIKGVTLPPGCRENFPCAEAGGSNRWKRDEVDSWVNRYLKPSATQGNSLVQMDDISRQQKADADVAEMKAEQMRRSVSNQWIQTAIADGVIHGFGVWIGTNMDSHHEDRHGMRRLVLKVVRELLEQALGKRIEDGGLKIDGNAADPSSFDLSQFLTILDSKLTGELRAANEAMKTAIGHQAGDLLAQLVKDREEQIKQMQ